VRLRELKVKNFRKLDDLTVTFPKGLSVIVGENNTGKTAIIDALRLMLMPSRDLDALRITEDDFRSGTEFAPIEISCTFCDATDTEEAHCQECLVDIGGGKFEIRLNARVEFNKETRRANVKMWGAKLRGEDFHRTFTTGSRPSISNHYAIRSRGFAPVATPRFPDSSTV
jgi:putative ATP-dependent endonuclease of OLD family